MEATLQDFREIKSPDRLAWRVNDFCRALGISRTNFYALLRENRIRTIVIGRRRLIPDAEARRIISEGAQ